MPWFSDPTAFELLPAHARDRVREIRQGRPPQGAKDVMSRTYLVRQAKIIAARTETVDAVIRSASARQVVLLGAGLDGRAYRLDELADATVFEVDHPDSQQHKRARAALLRPTARDVRFVPVDFATDDLNEALNDAGHDATIPTIWIWEGVVMYLDLAAIEETLGVIARRSAPGSRLVLMYVSRSPVRHLVNEYVKRLGEPFRSSFSPTAMRRLMRKHGFTVDDDRRLDQIGAELGQPVGDATAGVTRHQRFAVATSGSL